MRSGALSEGAGTLVGDVNIATLAPDIARISLMTTEPILLRNELIRMSRRVLDAFGAPHSGPRAVDHRGRLVTDYSDILKEYPRIVVI